MCSHSDFQQPQESSDRKSEETKGRSPMAYYRASSHEKLGRVMRTRRTTEGLFCEEHTCSSLIDFLSSHLFSHFSHKIEANTNQNQPITTRKMLASTPATRIFLKRALGHARTVAVRAVSSQSSSFVPTSMVSKEQNLHSSRREVFPFKSPPSFLSFDLSMYSFLILSLLIDSLTIHQPYYHTS